MGRLALMPNQKQQNQLIKDIKRNAFGYKNVETFKIKILLAFDLKRERTKSFSRTWNDKSTTRVNKEPKFFVYRRHLMS